MPGVVIYYRPTRAQKGICRTDVRMWKRVVWEFGEDRAGRRGKVGLPGQIRK